MEFGFTDFFSAGINLSELEICDKTKINIFVMHGDLDASDKSAMLYNPVSSKALQQKGFDYIALGHIHKTNFEQNGSNIIYPGSPISFGFDELGEHGVIAGEVGVDNTSAVGEPAHRCPGSCGQLPLRTQFISMDNKEFVEYELDVTEINSKEELVEILNSINVPENNFYKVIFVGKRNFEINKYNIIKLINNDRILKLKDLTKIKYNLDEIAKEVSLKGYFVRTLLGKQCEYDKTEWERAMEIGLNVL